MPVLWQRKNISQNWQHLDSGSLERVLLHFDHYQIHKCADGIVRSYNSGYTNGVSSGKGTNATVTILGAAGGHGAVYFAINLTVNSNGTVHVNSISRTGSAGSPYDFGDIRMGLTITGTDGSSVIARD